jgi:hypothetical protein
MTQFEVSKENPPIVKCPHCTQEILIDIGPFRKDVTKIMQDKCIKCGGIIVVSLLILCDTSMHRMLHTIKGGRRHG